jgi:hypothetical protein
MLYGDTIAGNTFEGVPIGKALISGELLLGWRCCLGLNLVGFGGFELDQPGEAVPVVFGRLVVGADLRLRYMLAEEAIDSLLLPSFLFTFSSATLTGPGAEGIYIKS